MIYLKKRKLQLKNIKLYKVISMLLVLWDLLNQNQNDYLFIFIMDYNMKFVELLKKHENH